MRVVSFFYRQWGAVNIPDDAAVQYSKTAFVEFDWTTEDGVKSLQRGGPVGME